MQKKNTLRMAISVIAGLFLVLTSLMPVSAAAIDDLAVGDSVELAYAAPTTKGYDGHRYILGRTYDKETNSWSNGVTSLRFRYYDDITKNQGWRRSEYALVLGSGGHSNEDLKLFRIKKGSDTFRGYCIEFGVPAKGTSTAGKLIKPTASDNWSNLTTTTKNAIQLILMFGYHQGGYTDPSVIGVSGANGYDYYVATQCLVWEYQQGLRDSIRNSALKNNVNSSNSSDVISSNTFKRSYKGRPAEKCVNAILKKAKDYIDGGLSFKKENDSANTTTLKYNPDTGEYTGSVQDTNNTNLAASVIQSALSGTTVTRNSSTDTYTFKRTTATGTDGLNSDYFKKEGYVNMRSFVIGHIKGSSDGWNPIQEISLGATLPSDAPFKQRVKIKTEDTGTLKIEKTVKDKNGNAISTFNNKKFKVTITLGKDGRSWQREIMPGTVFSEKFPAGTYTIREEAEPDFNDGAAVVKTGVKVTAGGTATSSIVNTYKPPEQRLATLVIIAKDKETNNTINSSNFSFRVIDPDGNAVSNGDISDFATDMYGNTARITVTKAGTYRIVPTLLGSEGTYYDNLASGENVTVSVTDAQLESHATKEQDVVFSPKMGELGVIKYMQDPLSTSLGGLEEGATFEVFENGKSYSGCSSYRRYRGTTGTDGRFAGGNAKLRIYGENKAKINYRIRQTVGPGRAGGRANPFA